MNLTASHPLAIAITLALATIILVTKVRNG
mgnify:CR=1 FL=1